MASSLNYKVIFLLIVNGYLFVTTPQAEPRVLDKVCQKTLSKDFCLNVFGSDPATHTASLPVLAQLAIDKATDRATKTRAESKTRALSEPNPDRRELLNQCVHYYDGSLASLRTAPFDLSRGRYADLNRHAHDAVTQAYDCELDWGNKYMDSPLFLYYLQLMHYCDIIEVIANMSN